MTDTITKIRVLADDFADSGRTYEGCDVARALNGFADRCEATNPTRSDESELRGSVTIEEKEDGDWLRFSPPEGASAMVLLDGIGGPIIQRSIRATAAALSKTVEDPPPTATEEGPQSVSEGADRARVSDWARAVGPAAADRYLAGETASDVADDFCVGDWTSEQVVEALAAVELNVRDDAPEGAESSRGGYDSPAADIGDLFNRLEAAIQNVGVGNSWTMLDTIKFVLRNQPANHPSPEEGVRLTGEFVAKRNPDGEIEHHFNGEGDADVQFAATPEAIPLTGPVEILIRPLSEGESNE